MFGLVAAASAFLLFTVELLVAKRIVVIFGGAAAVWTTCLVFFQLGLLAGYAYANAVVRRLAPRGQALLHTAALAASVAAIGVAPPGSAQATPGGPPALGVLTLLATSVGLPFVLLSTTGPLVQAWYARVRGRDPYHLYAASNAASLGALVAYPFVIEPAIPVALQARLWCAAYAAFAVGCAVLAWRAARAPAPSPAGAKPSHGTSGGGAALDGAARPSAARWALWIALAATASLLLGAVTNHLTQNIAAVPLLWVAPLTLYLLSFVLCFDRRRWYRPWPWFAAAIAAIAAMGWLVAERTGEFTWWVQIPAFCLGLFALCMLLHGELARLRPPAEGLTEYYVAVAAGGALGALAVGIGAPVALRGYDELPIALAACALAAVAVFVHGRNARFRAAVAGATAIAASGFACHRVGTNGDGAVLATRNFYGVLVVEDREEGGGWIRQLTHGTILHGEQWLAPESRREPTQYYRASSGVGLAIRTKQAAGPVRVGVVGLGAGTLAAYGRAGDVVRFYEINPTVAEIARREFTFLADTPAAVDVVLGDARRTLESERGPRWDVLAIDAFSGDAIPIHLVTVEALEVYLRRVTPDGIVAFHVSNQFLDLIPVVRALAAKLGLAAVHVEDVDEDDDSLSDWVLVSRDPSALERPEIAEAASEAAEEERPRRAWTDDFNDVLGALR